jgi:hypothetical protein
MQNGNLELTCAEMEQALKYLDSDDNLPPKNLFHLKPQDWLFLSLVLDNLMQEKQRSSVH